MSMNGRGAIVTGASQGIGLAVAEVLIARGARVAGLARDAGRLQEAADRLGGAFLPVACDVGNADQVEQAVRAAQKAFGSVDILINNAGVGRFGPVDELAMERWEEMLATNISGLFHCIRRVVPIMKAQGRGHIVNVSSIAGKVGYPNASGYNATKFAVRGLSEALTAELEAFGIKVSTLYPGVTNTEFGSGRPAPGTPRMEPEEVAEAVLHVLERSDGFLITEMVMRPLRRNVR
jgi:NADP-dependent 3-hydroxy acid dehydrogenase YdfG